MQTDRRPWIAVIVVFVVLGLSAVCMLQPPSTDPAPVQQVQVQLPEPAAFPEEVAPGSMHNGRRKPHPEDPPPQVQPTDTQHAWHGEIAQLGGEANGACGTRIEPICYGGACVAVITPGASHRMMRFWRRPQLLVESILPFEASRCGAASARLQREHTPYLGSGPACQGWLLEGHDRARFEAQALCEQARQSPGI